LADCLLVFRAQFLEGVDLIHLGPPLIPHLSFERFSQNIFDFKQVAAEASKQKSIQVFVPGFTVKTQLKIRTSLGAGYLIM
jgi:hypothetical protein